MAKSKLTEEVVEVLKEFCRNGGNKKWPFNNELELQMYVGSHLQKQGDKNGFKVLYEYHVPPQFIVGADKEMYLDIVVTDNDEKEYVPIEIKYKTRNPKKWNMAGYTILGKSAENKENIELLRNQGAHDLGMYGFWKDVRRLELVSKNFDAVKNGIALFVTNDPTYFEEEKTVCDKNNKKKLNYFNFRMTENRQINNESPTELKWLNENSKLATDYKDKYPAFKLEGNYKIEWNDFGLCDSKTKNSKYQRFQYCLVTV